MKERKNFQQIGIYSIISCIFGAIIIINKKQFKLQTVMKYLKLSCLLALSLALVSCEKVSLDDLLGKDPTTSQPATGNANLNIHIGGIENVNYNSAAKGTRAIEPVKNVCSKLTISLYREDGTRAFMVNKKSTEAGFADATVKLAEGNYKLLVIAHSNDKNATTTDLNKITFDGKVSDTFHYYEEIELTEGNNNIDVVLSRVTAMFRLEITDDIPENVKQLKFYYTGGSSTLEGVTGYGCVNSKQTELRDIKTGSKIYEVYTFPHPDGKTLKMTILALDASNNILCEKAFENVSISRNTITHYRGKLFETVTPPAASKDFVFNITADTSWLGENVVDF